MKRSGIESHSTLPTRRRRINALLGAAAGFVNGLLGAGGGIIMVYAFNRTYGKDEDGVKNAFASTVAAMLPVSLVSALTYTFSKTAQITAIPIYAVPAALGGLLGARLTDRFSAERLRRIFAFTVIYAGINMIVRS